MFSATCERGGGRFHVSGHSDSESFSSVGNVLHFDVDVR